MTNGDLFVRAGRSARLRSILATSLALALAACSDDGGTAGTSGSGGGSSQGGGGTGASGTGGATSGSGGGATGTGGGLGDPQFEGTFWVESHAHVGGAFDADAYGLFWELASAQGPVDEWFDQVIGSAAPLAAGECALITQGAAPAYTSVTVGPSVIVRAGSTDLVTTTITPPDDFYDGAATSTAATALHDASFTLAIDPGDATIGPLTSGALGPLVDVTLPTTPSCSLSSDCLLTIAPSAPVDDMLFLFDLTYVCRGNPTTGEFTIPVDVLAADGDTQANVQVYAVKRQSTMMGASTVDVQLVTRSEFLVTLQ